ncbi:monooxygenase [Aaosphaeria arxii CBS 175.79]|uniref:Monooxygenase n=1 Tax=Aaosphaeria arxii CBS 175.79 TaxID=1450172 RepID=A0A6A5XZ19_9PLEO|nr:monooxygenase [Aaosphaeria arxii CBS 175.79]KAF2018067.1 monooxygenase [Aaosphaeria arxii CBS 175.79]
MPGLENHSFNGGAPHKPPPIIIAGGGCVGPFLAFLLSKSAIPNPVIVIEPHRPNRSDTKAMAHQPHVFPLFEAGGLMPDLAQLGSFSAGLCFRTSVANDSLIIAGVKFPSPEKSVLLLPQWKFQNLLMEKLEAAENTKVRLGQAVERFEQLEDHVAVTIVDGEGKEEVIQAAYLIGADGAKSHIRKMLGVDFVGETLPAQLVATDTRFPFHEHGFWDANFVIDPVDYGLIGRIDDEGLWRVSYGVPPGMTEDEIRAGVHEKLERLLPNAGKNAQGERMYEVVRVAPYKVQQRAVDTFWAKGARVGLCGDAAHLTNAYAGLGLASGIADAGALAQVLERILTGQATNPEVLLSAWGDARKDKFLKSVDKPSRMAYARVKSKVDTVEEIEALLTQDPLLSRMNQKQPMMPLSLITNCEELEGW